MKTEKTTDERLRTYALNQQPMDDLDRHMPPTKPRTFMLYLLASPLLALGAWLVLIWACLNTDAN
jgi:hypothetical protein